MMRWKRVVSSFAIVAVVLFASACVQGQSARTTTDGLRSRGEDQALFEVSTTHPDYWRVATLDRFDGTSWMPAGSDGDALTTPAILAESLGPHGTAAPTTSTFRILSDGLVTTALPVPSAAIAFDGTVGSISWDRRSGRVVMDGGPREGTEYTVRAAPVVPTPEQLDRSRAASPNGRWTELPPDFDPRFESLAQEWTADAASDYREVLAIQQRFQLDDFIYSTDVPAPTSPQELLDFLTRTKVGFCEHYSSSMAVLVRSLGIPARIGVGFRLGTLQDDGSYLVHESDGAHAWVEVRFAGYGWLPFEPEHGATHPYARPGTYLDP
jgi:Transglutaminase-like superfamily/TgpA N-terminal domain